MCYVEPLVPVAVCRLYKQKHVAATDRKGQTTAAAVFSFSTNQAHHADALKTFLQLIAVPNPHLASHTRMARDHQAVKHEV